MKRWVSTPERPPWKCPFTHQDQAEDGPYLEADLLYAPIAEDGRQNGRPEQLYLSPQALREASQLPNSPIVVLDRASYHAAQDALEASQAELQAANDRVADLEAQLSDYRDHAANPIDVEVLAASLAPLLAESKPKPRSRS